MLLAEAYIHDLSPFAIRFGDGFIRWYGLAYLTGSTAALPVLRWMPGPPQSPPEQAGDFMTQWSSGSSSVVGSATSSSTRSTCSGRSRRASGACSRSTRAGWRAGAILGSGSPASSTTIRASNNSLLDGGVLRRSTDQPVTNFVVGEFVSAHRRCRPNTCWSVYTPTSGSRSTSERGGRRPRHHDLEPCEPSALPAPRRDLRRRTDVAEAVSRISSPTT